jgi:hypothetical protein
MRDRFHAALDDRGALDRIRRADVGFWCAGLDRDADAGFDQLDLAVGGNFALLGEICERITDHDQDVGRFATLESHGIALTVVPIDGP